MTADAWLTLAVLAATVAVLVLDRYPVVLVMGSAVATLLFTDVIDSSTALSGFATEAPATIAALYVLAGAASATGAVGGVVDRAMVSSRGALTRLTTVTATLSAFLPNTPLVALFTPRVIRAARRLGRPASLFLMPLSYASVLGGVITLIGTSTNLVVNDVLQREGHDELSMFEMTPVGLPVAIVGVALLCLVAPRLLPRREGADESLRSAVRQFNVVMTVDPAGPLVHTSVADGGLRNLQGVFLVAVERHGSMTAATPELVLAAGDHCFFVGDLTRILDLQEVAGLVSAEQPHLLDTERPGARLYEAVVSQQSSLHGETLKSSGFRGRYEAAVLAIHRPAGDVAGKLGSIVLRTGDVLLLLADAGFAARWRHHSDFSLIASIDEPPPPRRGHAWLPTVALLAMVAAVTADVLSLFEAALAAAALVVAGGAISLGEARRAVNLNVILTIAISISLGAAVSVSGLAAEMAAAITDVGAPFGTVGQLVAVLVSTMALTELLSNNAAAALMLPVGLAVAEATVSDPRAFAIAILVGASCSFLSPVGYQTNLMVYGLGGYRFLDFTKVGFPLTLATIVVTTVALAPGLQ